MKKFVTALTICALLLSLCACGQGTAGQASSAEGLTWQEQYDLGVRYLEDGDYEEAIIAFTAAIEIDPKRAEAYTSLAEIYMEQGDYNKAVDILEQGVSNLNGEDAPVLEELLASAQRMASIDFENLVTDAYRESITDYDDTSVWAIPKIMLDDPDVVKINEEIWAELYDNTVQNTLETVLQGGSVGNGISYQWAVNEDILSLCIRCDPWDWAWTDFYVYNVSVSTGKELSDRKVYQAAGFTSSDYRERVKEAAGSSFWSGFPEDPSWMENFDPYYAELFNTQLERTIAQENIDQAIPFLNKDGQLCIVIPVYSIAAADYYWTLLNLEDFELVPDFEKGI